MTSIAAFLCSPTLVVFSSILESIDFYPSFREAVQPESKFTAKGKMQSNDFYFLRKSIRDFVIYTIWGVLSFCTS